MAWVGGRYHPKTTRVSVAAVGFTTTLALVAFVCSAAAVAAVLPVDTPTGFSGPAELVASWNGEAQAIHSKILGDGDNGFYVEPGMWGGSFSVAGSMLPKVEPGFQNIVSRGHGGFQFALVDGKFWFGLVGDQSSGTDLTMENLVVDEGKEYIFALTYHAGTAKLYLNDKLAALWKVRLATTSETPFYVAAQDDEGHNAFKGLLCRLQLWKGAMTPEQVVLFTAATDHRPSQCHGQLAPVKDIHDKSIHNGTPGSSLKYKVGRSTTTLVPSDGSEGGAIGTGVGATPFAAAAAVVSLGGGNDVVVPGAGAAPPPAGREVPIQLTEELNEEVTRGGKSAPITVDAAVVDAAAVPLPPREVSMDEEREAGGGDDSTFDGMDLCQFIRDRTTTSALPGKAKKVPSPQVDGTLSVLGSGEDLVKIVANGADSAAYLEFASQFANTGNTWHVGVTAKNSFRICWGPRGSFKNPESMVCPMEILYPTNELIFTQKVTFHGRSAGLPGQALELAELTTRRSSTKASGEDPAVPAGVSFLEEDPSAPGLDDADPNDMSEMHFCNFVNAELAAIPLPKKASSTTVGVTSSVEGNRVEFSGTGSQEPALDIFSSSKNPRLTMFSKEAAVVGCTMHTAATASSPFKIEEAADATTLGLGFGGTGSVILHNDNTVEFVTKVTFMVPPDFDEESGRTPTAMEMLQTDVDVASSSESTSRSLSHEYLTAAVQDVREKTTFSIEAKSVDGSASVRIESTNTRPDDVYMQLGNGAASTSSWKVGSQGGQTLSIGFGPVNTLNHAMLMVLHPNGDVAVYGNVQFSGGAAGAGQE